MTLADIDFKIRSSIVNYRASIILTARRDIADFASENEHGHVGATGRIQGQREYNAFPASMRKHLTSANCRPMMPINNALPNADCNDTRVGKGNDRCGKFAAASPYYHRMAEFVK